MDKFLIIVRMLADYAWLIWGFTALVLWTDLWVSLPLFAGYMVVMVYTNLLFRNLRGRL